MVVVDGIRAGGLSRARVGRRSRFAARGEGRKGGKPGKCAERRELGGVLSLSLLCCLLLLLKEGLLVERRPAGVDAVPSRVTLCGPRIDVGGRL